MAKSLIEKKNEIIEIAKQLFLKEGIEKVLISDVAKKSNVGEATIYRYFQKKENLIVLAAVSLENELIDKYFKIKKESNGLESIKSFYNIFLEVFKNHIEYYKFLLEFDLYLLNNDNLELDNYENGIEKFKEYYLKFIKLGIEDKSIKKDLDYELFFNSSCHSLLALSKHLSIDKALIKQDLNLNKIKEIECLISSFINYIKN